MISDRKFWSSDLEKFGFNQIDLKYPSIDLLHFKQDELIIWISLYSLDRIKMSNNFLKIGIGYTMVNNTLSQFVPRTKEANNILRSIKTLKLDESVNVIENRVEDLPVIQDPSVRIYDIDRDGFNDLNTRITTKEDLPVEGKRLYDIVRSRGLNMGNDVLDAINYSIESMGCSLNMKLREKAKKSFGSSNQKTSYLRVTFEYADGSSPGQPYVLEIWPKGHFSPIHNHGNTVGLIKMLDGSLISDYFNPLTERNNIYEDPVKTISLHAGQITWLTPNMYQTHRLTNLNSTRAAISIQAYSHLNDFDNHEESFNYILPNGGDLKRFYPTPDYTFEDLIEITKTEYEQNICNNPAKMNCCPYSGKVCGHLLNRRSKENYCKFSADHNSLYNCNKISGKFELIEACSQKCYQDYLSSRCEEKNKAISVINHGKWKNVSGFLTLEDFDENKIRISGMIEGLKKSGLHGFHIHEYGDITSECDRLGSHYDPLSIKTHGNVADFHFNKHLGDLGNIESDKNGKAKIDIILHDGLINLSSPGKFSLMYRSFAIHENGDDLGKGLSENSRVNGNSGPIIACGQIRTDTTFETQTTQPTYSANTSHLSTEGPKHDLSNSALNVGTEDVSVATIYRTCFGPSEFKLRHFLYNI
ncbi:cysteine dioxygenase [Brachionus plicatilis]|uniref:cysteine dioxygenase n=1 Tax=Brachionus plicatilis TaxID=10195 RepID=A0A3M7PU48_BRAPC|nr:cysteine dioxygenase [Brachionus plicatilis]